MRILAVETHFKDLKDNIRTSAVDFWRIINPFTHLKKNTNWKIEIRKGVLIKDWAFGSPQANLEWEQVAKNFDFVWSSYFGNPFTYSYLGVLGEKYGLKHVMDLDDDLLHISFSNPVMWYFQKEKNEYENFKKVIKITPYMSVTNSHLKKVYKDFKDFQGKIWVLPNYIDPDLWINDPHIEDEVITIGYQGGSTHMGDLIYQNEEFFGALTYILGKYQGKVKLKIFGAYLPLWQNIPYVAYQDGNSDFYEYLKIRKKWIADVDIGICPLAEDEYNLSKSSIKHYEYAIAKVPVIVQDYGPYKFVQDGKTGLKARDFRSWVQAFEFLIENKVKRKEIGERGYKYVMDNCTIQKNWQKWKEVIEEIQLRKKGDLT